MMKQFGEKRTERDRMPDGFTDGLLSAKDDFVGGVIKAKNAVLRDPLRKISNTKRLWRRRESSCKNID